MTELPFGSLKEKRLSLGLSQKKLSSLAGISLTTLRQMEEGSSGARRRTVNRVLAAIEKIELGGEAGLGLVPLKTRARRKSSKVAKEKASERIKRSARPRKIVEIQPPGEAGEPAINQTPATTNVQPAFKLSPQKHPVTQNASAPLHLTNIDLELINRMLGLNPEQKLDLLKYLFKLE
ncbi:MAG: helix-turn-helix domain-containing protein [Calditrichota bacterium]